MNKDNLINIRATLHGKERPIYILWLLDCIEEQAAPFLSEKDSRTKVRSLSPSLFVMNACSFPEIRVEFISRTNTYCYFLYCCPDSQEEAPHPGIWVSTLPAVTHGGLQWRISA
jgi:hypothetical protein